MVWPIGRVVARPLPTDSAPAPLEAATGATLHMLTNLLEPLDVALIKGARSDAKGKNRSELVAFWLRGC